MGSAAYGMREWEKAANYFKQVLEEFPNNATAVEQLKRAIDRMTEENTGKFDFNQMALEAGPELDVADYKGPIEIADIQGKGIVFFLEAVF